MQRAFVFVVLLALLALPGAAHAQTGELVLQVHREFGYGGLDTRIRGRFSLEVEGTEDLARVDFYVDDELVGSVGAPPFRIEFRTDDYPPGEHQLYAIGETNSGAQLRSNETMRVFLTEEQVNKATLDLFVPLIVAIAGVVVLVFLLQRFLNRNQEFKLGVYGMAGGAVCKKCGKPFSRHTLSPNLLVGKLERCPHCGKTAIVRRATPDQLAEAEARMRAEEGGGIAQSEESPEERLRRQIEQSRYD